MQYRFTTFIIFISILVSARSVAQLPVALDRYVDSVLTTFEVPGLSLAIVRDGKVELAKGYGIKRLGETSPVDEHTVFPIASNSKAFTAMAMAILVDEGKIKWDDPVIRYLPWFRMSDPWVTAQLSIRDLLVHHSGIPAYAGDILIFPPSSYTRRQILEKLRDVPLVRSFRTTYAYDNIMYVAAGELISAVSGMDYEDFVRLRILKSAGMSQTIARFSDIKNLTNKATGHLSLQGTLVPVDQFGDQLIGDVANAAGGIASNAVDMAKWMITELDSGRTPDHTQIVHSTAMRELWRVITPIPLPSLPAGLKRAQMDFYGYALGVRISNYGQYKIVNHGGKLDGFVSHVILVPRLRLGIAVLTNQVSTGAYNSLIFHLLDHYLQNRPYPWLGEYAQLKKNANAEWKTEWDQNVVIATIGAPKPTVADLYVGKYTDPFYGDLVIEKDAGTPARLTFHFIQTPLFTGSLEPFQFETFKASFKNKTLLADSYLTFTRAPDGTMESCQLRVLDPASDVSFDGLVFHKKK